MKYARLLNMILTDEQIFDYNRQGLIPGPEESEEEFAKRAIFCLNIRKELALSVDPELAHLQETLPVSAEILRSADKITEELFGIHPDWVPVFFSDHNLAPWHGGCAWIFQLSDATPTAALLQLRKAFYTKKCYLGLYDREELIAHEMAHVGRMMYQEKKFEEILAYKTSKSWFRRWLGPIVQSSKETLLFAILLAAIIGMEFLTFYYVQFYDILTDLKLFAILLILLALGRLFVRQRQCQSCLKKLKELVQDENKANALLYRLTDDEMTTFRKMNIADIKEHIRHLATLSLRGKVLNKYI